MRVDAVISHTETKLLSSSTQRFKYKKEATKTKNHQCPFNSVQLKIREGSPKGISVIVEERYLLKRWVLSLEWKVEGVLDGESEWWLKRWYAQDEMNKEESKQNEVDGIKKGADSTSEVIDAYVIKAGMSSFSDQRFPTF